MTVPAELGYAMPPEWHPHDATWLAWPKDPLTWPDRVPQVEAIFLQMIERAGASRDRQRPRGR